VRSQQVKRPAAFWGLYVPVVSGIVYVTSPYERIS
jgi:hypothetical protein